MQPCHTAGRLPKEVSCSVCLRSASSCHRHPTLTLHHRPRGLELVEQRVGPCSTRMVRSTCSVRTFRCYSSKQLRSKRRAALRWPRPARGLLPLAALTRRRSGMAPAVEGSQPRKLARGSGRRQGAAAPCSAGGRRFAAVQIKICRGGGGGTGGRRSPRECEYIELEPSPALEATQR